MAQNNIPTGGTRALELDLNNKPVQPVSLASTNWTDKLDPGNVALTPATTFTDSAPFTRLPIGWKMFGGNLVPKPSDNGEWFNFWIDNYDWAGWLKPQIDAAHNMGMNSIRAIITTQSALRSADAQNLLLARFAQMCDYAASLGMYVLATGDGAINGGALPSMNQRIAWLTALTSLVNTKQNVFAMDVFQEWDGQGGISLGDANTLYSAIKPLSQVPLGFSSVIAADDPNWFRNQGPLAAALSLGDYFDLHIYHDVGDLDWLTVLPMLESINKPLLIGETGYNASGSRGCHPSTLLGIASHPLCVGVLAWALSDQSTDPNNQWGIFDVNLLPRVSKVAAYQALPTRSFQADKSPAPRYVTGAAMRSLKSVHTAADTGNGWYEASDIDGPAPNFSATFGVRVPGQSFAGNAVFSTYHNGTWRPGFAINNDDQNSTTFYGPMFPGGAVYANPLVVAQPGQPTGAPAVFCFADFTYGAVRFGSQYGPYYKVVLEVPSATVPGQYQDGLTVTASEVSAPAKLTTGGFSVYRQVGVPATTTTAGKPGDLAIDTGNNRFVFYTGDGGSNHSWKQGILSNYSP